MRSTFPLFQSHLDLAHYYWTTLIKMDDEVIDATCGNGYDTLKLCQLALCSTKGMVYGFDIQTTALEKTQKVLTEHLSSSQLKRTALTLGCHSEFPPTISSESIKLIVYNLGYLPGGNKKETTQTTTTLKSLQKALLLIAPGGAISLTCYPGHSEGSLEEEAILQWSHTLSPFEWSCCHHRWLNRQNAPSLLLIQKKF